jgi:PAS domain S-box-containing protein
MKHKYLFMILLLWLFSCLFFFQMIYGEAKQKAIDELNARQMILARQAKTGIENFFTNTLHFLNKIAESTDVIDLTDNGRQQIDLALKFNPDEITAITRVDETGKIVYTAPFSQELIGKDISYQEHIQKIMKHKKPVLSDVFTAVQGYRAVALHVPIVKQGEFKGTIGVLINFFALSQRFLEVIQIDKTGYAWMTSEKGIELFCPVPGHTGRSVFENCKDFPTIISMANEMVKGNRGVTTYEFDRIREKEIETVKKHAVYLPISLADTFWSIVVATSEEELLASLVSFKNKLFFIFALLLGGSFFFSYYAMKSRGIVREQAHRKRAEEELQRIFSMSLDMICVADIQTATFLKVNPAFTEILGFSEQELLEKPFLDFIHPEDVELTRNVVEQKLRTGAKVINFNNRYRCRDGSYRWLSWVSHPIPEKGVTYAVARDITEQKENEEALKKNKALLDATGRMARVGGWELETGTLEVIWTDETYRIHELPPDHKPPLSEAIDFFHPEDRPVLERAIERALEHGTPYDLEIRFITARGNHLWTRTTCRPEIADGKTVRLVGTFQDITDRKNAEDALRESEERYRTVLETINEGVILQAASGEILTWNKGAEDIFGIPSKEAIGKTSEGEDWPTIQADGSKYEGKDHPSLRTLQTGKPCRNEVMGVYQPSGELHWISINTHPLFRDDDPKPYAVVISFSDITEIKKEKDQSQMYLDATTDGIWTWNFKTNTLFFSPKYYEMLGYSPDAFPADYEHWVELIHPDDREKSLAAAAEYLRKKPDHYENEFRLRTADEAYRWIHARAKVVKRDTQGDAVLMVGNHEDITERKQSELALRESEEKFRNFAEQSFVGFYIIQDDLFKYVNPKFADIFGYTVDECNGMHFRQLVHTEDLATVQGQVHRRVAGEVEAVQHTFRGVKKTGEIIHVSIYGSSSIYQGRPAAIGTMLDITKDLEMEKRMAQSQRMEAIGSLAGGIAHDFNNILFPIVGLSEMLIDDLPPGSNEHQNAVQIYKAGNRGSDLVKQILAFSRQSEQKKMPIRLQQILKEVIKLSRSTIPANINITQDIESDCGLVQADATQIHQIAMNLVTNAYHAVETKSGKISVRLREVEIGLGQLPESDLLPGRYAVLSVSDTGLGIDPAIMDKIFDPYFTTKEQGKGTGLGLAVVYGIVKEHHGDIKVYSELGKGTTFKVYLPIMAKAEKSESIAGKEDCFEGHERILLVDDEEPIVKSGKADA